MIDTPMPFGEAIHYLQNKHLLPTEMTSVELRTLSKQIRARSFFSAQTFYADYLASLKNDIDKILNPETAFGGIPVSREGSGPTIGLDIATACANARKFLEEKGYLADEGDVNTIKDLASDARLNLVLKTNIEQAQGFGRDRKAQDPAVLDEYPAWELKRLEDRDVPRGEKMVKGEIVEAPGEDWEARFEAAGEESGEEDGWGIFDGRMIALKNHPIWDALGDGAGGFDDSLGQPFEPFAFNSGYGRVHITRDEAVELGLIDEDTQIEPKEMEFEEDPG